MTATEAIQAEKQVESATRQQPAGTPYDRYRETKVFSALNGLRCICALGILKIHCRWSTPRLALLDHGDLGVDLFFVISGFLIVTLLLRERERFGDINLKKFYARRTLRIFPIYYGLILAVLASFLVIAPWKPNGLKFYLPMAAVLLTYTTDILRVVVPGGIFFHCWSLAMEEQFYLVWPALEKRLAARAKWVVLGLALAFNQLINFGVLGPVIDRIYGDASARLMPIFLITFTPIILGVVLAHLLHDRRSFDALYRVVGHRAAPLVWLAVIVAIVQSFGESNNQGLPKLTLHLALMLGLASVVVREDHVARRVLTFPLLERLGATSYGIYLYHVAILDLMKRIGHDRWSPMHLFFTVTPLTVVVAELSFRYFESRFLSLRGRFQPRVPGRVAAAPLLVLCLALAALSPACKTSGGSGPHDASTAATAGAGGAGGSAGVSAGGAGTVGAAGTTGGPADGGAAGTGTTQAGCPSAPPVDFDDTAVRAKCGKLVYVAGGDNFHIVISSDGAATWRSFSINDIDGEDYVNHIVVAQGFIFVVGYPGLYVSKDGGQTFTRIESVAHNRFESGGGQISYGAGRFILTANQGTYVSTDGTTWQSEKPFPDGSAPDAFPGHFHGPAYGAGKYVVAQDNGALRVFDGTVWWQGVLIDKTRDVFGFAHGNGAFVVMGQAGAGSFSATSADGKSWTNVQTADATGAAFSGVASGLVFDGTTFHAYRRYGGQTGYTSTDGKAWTKIALSHGLNGVAQADGHYFGLDDKTLLLSSDGKTWTSTHTLTSDEKFAINGPRVAVGYVLR